MKYIKEQIIELSHPLINGRENFKYSAKPNGRMKTDDWYIGCVAELSAHAGTHVEVPYHHNITGLDCMGYPVDRLIGEAIVINCEGKEPGDPITAEDLKKYPGQIQDGDIVFLHTGYDKYFRKENWQPYPYVTEEALKWLLQYHPKVLGTDASGIEISDGYMNGRMHELYGEPIHSACFANGIAIVESLTNLEAVEGLRTTVFILPMPAQGMDASPVRIIAIKDLDN